MINFFLLYLILSAFYPLNPMMVDVPQRIIAAAQTGNTQDLIGAILHDVSEPADLNVQNAQGLTALHVACAQANEEMVGVLLDCGASMNVSDSNGRTPLFKAIYTTSASLVALLRAKAQQIDNERQNCLKQFPWHMPEPARSLIARYTCNDTCNAEYTLLHTKDNEGNIPYAWACKAAKEIHECMKTIRRSEKGLRSMAIDLLDNLQSIKGLLNYKPIDSVQLLEYAHQDINQLKLIADYQQKKLEILHFSDYVGESGLKTNDVGNQRKALHFYLTLLIQNGPSALKPFIQLQIGHMLLAGKAGFKINKANNRLALSLFEKAYNQDVALDEKLQAAYWLGRYYINGLPGVPVNIPLAIEYLLEAATANSNYRQEASKLLEPHRYAIFAQLHQDTTSLVRLLPIDIVDMIKKYS